MAAPNAAQPHLPAVQQEVVGRPQQSPIQVPLPDRFNFGSSDTWPAWVRRFDRFRIASGLANRPANDQISTMVYAMGDQAEDILRTLNIPNDATYDDLKQSLDRYFGVRHNLIIERAKFNKRIQQQGESVDVFIQDLYRLVEHCEYGELREQLIRDRIVVGVSDDALSDRLQAQADLTLEQSVQISRQSESRKPATNTLRGPGGVKLRLLGTLDAQLSCGDRSYSETLYVIENQGISLLSRNACVQWETFKARFTCQSLGGGTGRKVLC